MNRIEDEFKDKFSNQMLSDDGFDSDGLWDDITRDLDKNVKPSYTRHKSLILLLAFVLGLGAFGIYHNYTNAKDSAHQQDAIEKHISENNPKDVETPDQARKIERVNSSKQKSKSNSKNRSPIKSEIQSEIDSEIAHSENKNVENYDEPSESEGLNKSKVNKSAETKHEEPKKSGNLATSETSTSTNTRKNSVSKREGSNIFSTATTDQNQGNLSHIDKKEAFSADHLARGEEYSSPKRITEKNEMEEEASKNSRAENGTSSMEYNTNLVSSSNPLKAYDQDTEQSGAPNQSMTMRPFALPSQIYLVEYDHFIEIDGLPTTYLATENDESKNPTWEISFWGGINSTDLHYNSDLLPDLALVKSSAESSQMGMGSGLGLSQVYKNTYAISTGIEYHQSWSKFDYMKIDSTDVFKENQLVKVWVNSMTGDTIHRAYDDVFANRVTTLKVIHHNKYQRLTIPLQFGLQKRTQKFVYGLSVGATFNFTISQSGKTLDSSANIVEFENDSPVSTYRPFGIGLRISPLVGFRISEKMTLNIQPQWNWTARSQFDGSDITLHAQQLNLNLGVGYLF